MSLMKHPCPSCKGVMAAPTLTSGDDGIWTADVYCPTCGALWASAEHRDPSRAVAIARAEWLKVVERMPSDAEVAAACERIGAALAARVAASPGGAGAK